MPLFIAMSISGDHIQIASTCGGCGGRSDADDKSFGDDNDSNDDSYEYADLVVGTQRSSAGMQRLAA